jgi:hypothetical protein
MAKDQFSGHIPFEKQPRVKKNNWLIIFLSIAGVTALVAFGGQSEKSDSQKPVSASSSTPSQTTDVRNSSDCFIIKTDITMLRTSFSVGEDTPQEVSFLLDAARNDFSRAASSFTGSKAAWLEKMAELSGKVSMFIMTGTPQDGPKALDQLYANMNLVDQFCK